MALKMGMARLKGGEKEETWNLFRRWGQVRRIQWRSGGGTSASMSRRAGETVVGICVAVSVQ